MSPPAGGPVVGGPHLLDPPPPGAAAALAALWVAVTRAGGAVGYVADAPEEDIRAAAERVIGSVAAGREQLLVIDADGTMAGSVFLRPGDRATVAHRGELLRLMVHPDLQGRGWGSRLLAAAVARAAEVGLQQLLLSTRGGTELPAYYTRRGWTEVGVWPAALRIAEDDYRAEHWFQLRLPGCRSRR